MSMGDKERALVMQDEIIIKNGICVDWWLFSAERTSKVDMSNVVVELGETRPVDHLLPIDVFGWKRGLEHDVANDNNDVVGIFYR
mmetsp:Transcript_45850/g.53648  ORF Transcript_45850/g.53648 Transcript_45850/m.53648 type:complete len:85 (+) Transcript_45850:171-425(+)